MNHQDILRFFANFGIHPGCEYKPISLERLTVIVTAAARWHGESFAKVVMDSFMPEGEAIAAGYEDSCERYSFMSDTLVFDGPIA